MTKDGERKVLADLIHEYHHAEIQSRLKIKLLKYIQTGFPKPFIQIFPYLIILIHHDQISFYHVL